MCQNERLTEWLWRSAGSRSPRRRLAGGGAPGPLRTALYPPSMLPARGRTRAVVEGGGGRATPEKRAPKSLLELGRDEWWREAGRWAWGTCWGSDGRWAEEEGARWRVLRESRLDHVMDEQKKVFIHHMIRTPVFCKDVGKTGCVRLIM